MSGNINETTSELGIDVLIDFSGIEEISKAIERKIKLEAGQKLFEIKPSRYQFDKIKDMLKELEEKIDIIPKEQEMAKVRDVVIEKGKKMKPVIENLDEFIAGSPKGSGILTEHATKGLETILGRIYKEKETDFSKIEFDDDDVKKVFEKLKAKGYEEAKILAETLLGKDSETILNEIKKIYDESLKQKKEKPLTQASIIPLLKKEQRKQKEVGINPFEERDTLKTIEAFRKSAIDKVGEFVDLFTSGEISPRDFEDFINEKISSIDEKLKAEISRGRFAKGSERELIELAGQTKKILLAFQRFMLVTKDDERGKQNIQKMYELLSKGGDIPTEFTKDIKSILEDLSAETIKDVISLKLGHDMVEVILEGMDKAIKDEHMKKFMQEKLEEGVENITSTALLRTIGSINDIIVNQLLTATNVKEAAKLFEKEYLPNLQQIQDIFDKIDIEDMEKIKTASEYAGMLSGLKTINLEEITALFESMAILTDADIGEIFGIVEEVDKHKEDLSVNLEIIKSMISGASDKAKEAVRQSDTVFKTIDQMQGFLEAQKRDAISIKQRFEEILPSEEKSKETLNIVNKVSRQIEKMNEKFTEFDVGIKDVKKNFGTLNRQLTRTTTSLEAKTDILLTQLEGV